MAYGMLGHLGISRQNSFGTATTSYEFIPFISEGITTEVEQIFEEGMRARFAENPVREGLERISGDISLEAHPILIGHIFKGAFNSSVSTTTGAISGSYYLHEFIPNATSDFDAINGAVPPYTFQVHRDVTSAFQYTDTVFNSFSIEIAAGAIQKISASVLAKTTSIMAASSPSFAAGNPFTWNTCSVALGGAASGIFENITVDYTNQLEGVAFLDTTKRVGKFKRTGYQQVRASGTISFDNLAEYTIFKNQTEQRLLLTLDDTSVTSLNILTIDIPSMRYENFSDPIGGPGRITAAFDAIGVYNSTSSYAIRITLINSRTNGY